MARSRTVAFGPATYTLDADWADALEALRRHDSAAAHAMARRRQHHPPLRDGEKVSVSMFMMDAAPAAPLPSPTTQPPARIQTMATAPMVPVKIGDATFYVDATVARELDYARGLADGHAALARAAAQPGVQQQDVSTVPASAGIRAGMMRAGLNGPVTTTDAAEASRAYRDALRADEARRNDVNTPQGKYRERLRTAYLQGR